MLTQVTHWMEFAGTAFDAFLLGRLFLLKLNRHYLFITLGCVLAVLFDLTALSLRTDAHGNFRVFLYSRFLYAIVYPLVAWDVFEEMGAQIAKLRRFALTRLISGLFFALIFGVLMSAMLEGDDSGPDSALLVTLALVLWAGASTACLAFLITVHRVLRSQPLALPHNTNVWIRFYELSFAAEALYCFLTVLVPVMRVSWMNDSVSIIFMGFGMALTGWCIFKLRSIPSGFSTAPQNARLD